MHWSYIVVVSALSLFLAGASDYYYGACDTPGGGDTISYRSANSAYNSALSEGVTVTAPSGLTNGDMMIAMIADDWGQLCSLTGWTQLTTVDAGGCEHIILYREASGEGGSFAFDCDGAGDRPVVGIVAAFSKTGGSWDTASMETDDTTNTSATNSITTTSITPPAGSILVVSFANDGAMTVTSPPGSVSDIDSESGNGQLAIYAYYEARASESAVTKSVTWSGTDDNSAHALYVALQ